MVPDLGAIDPRPGRDEGRRALACCYDGRDDHEHDR
jgi:hypothetical protein